MMKGSFDVKSIVLVDASCPTDHVPLSGTLLDHIVTQGKPSRSEAEKIGSVREQFKKGSDPLKRYSPPPDGPHPHVAFLRSRKGLKVESGRCGMVSQFGLPIGNNPRRWSEDGRRC